MSIVTIRGHLGSGAPEIGKMIAEKLNYDYVDREIIEQVAKKLNWPKKGIEEKEKPPGSLGERILEALGRAYPAANYASAYVPAWEMPLNDSSYVSGLESIIKELANQRSIVIRGRGSQFILKDYADCIHVLIVAPTDVRVKRLITITGGDEESIAKDMQRSDNSRNEFTRRYFKAELEDPVYYDIVVNTAHISYKDAASIITPVIPLKNSR